MFHNSPLLVKAPFLSFSFNNETPAKSAKIGAPELGCTVYYTISNIININIYIYNI